MLDLIHNLKEYASLKIASKKPLKST